MPLLKQKEPCLKSMMPKRYFWVDMKVVMDKTNFKEFYNSNQITNLDRFPWRRWRIRRTRRFRLDKWCCIRLFIEIWWSHWQPWRVSNSWIGFKWHYSNNMDIYFKHLYTNLLPISKKEAGIFRFNNDHYQSIQYCQTYISKKKLNSNTNLL